MPKTKIIFSIAIIIFIIVGAIIYYIFSFKRVVDKQGGVLTNKDAIVLQQTSYEKDGNTFNFTKNRVTKTATVDIQYNLTQKDQFTTFLGDKITTAPFLINFLCGTLNQAFFDPEALNTASSSANTNKVTDITNNNQFKNTLAGYKVSEFSVDFKDKESKGQIAICRSSQKGFDSIKFTVVRNYSGYDSFLGQKIGVIQKGK